MDMDDQASQNAVSPNLDAQCASTASSPSDEDFNLRSYCESTAPSAAAVQQKDLIITTLSQIESICSEFLDDPKVQQDEGEQLTSPMDMITRTGVIAKRTQVRIFGEKFRNNYWTFFSWTIPDASHSRIPIRVKWP